MKKPIFIASMDACVDHILDTVIGTVVLGIPLGIGKPNPLVNVLYRRIKSNPARKLRIITALSLERPVGHSDLERNFLQPLVESECLTTIPTWTMSRTCAPARCPPISRCRSFS
jgi:hypothetical protein